MSKSLAATCFCCLTLTSSSLWSAVIWANQADNGNHHLQSRDTVTGAVVTDFTLPGNGRGVVVVGNVVYTTTASSNIVVKYDATTGASLGNAFSVAGASGLSTVAYDGTNFWIGDYSGTNQAYYYSPTGTLLSTISLSNCTGFCDGLEFFNLGAGGRLISNRGDNQSPGIYDIYDTAGNLITPGFINTGAGTSGTGIAFDGTNFYISSVATKRLLVYSSTGVFIRSVDVSAVDPFGIEDLSFDYSQRVDTGGTPEPATYLLFATGLGALALLKKRVKPQAS